VPTRAQSLQRNFGARVRELRLAAGLTQEVLAERCGLFRTYLSRIENGTANPTLTMIQALSVSLRVGITALFEPPAKVPRTASLGRPAKARSAPGTSRGRVR
jgi:transcriptional regulator with XRE-family HTH domain